VLTQPECQPLLLADELWVELGTLEELVTRARRISCANADCSAAILLPEGERPTTAACPSCERYTWIATVELPLDANLSLPNATSPIEHNLPWP